MKRYAFVTLIALSTATAATAQKFPGKFDASLFPKLTPHHVEEYNFDKSTNPQAWKSVSPGLHASFGSTEELYFNKEVPSRADMSQQQVIAWKGERVNFQVLIFSPDSLEQVRLTVNDLKSQSGQTIDKQNIQLQLVRYVVSNYPYGAKDAVCGESPYKDGYMMPDRFEKFDRFDLPGNTTRPVWVSVQVPANASPGKYTGTLEVVSEKHKTPLTVSITVQDETLPPPAEWRHLLDLWQNPWAVAWYNDVEPWSDEHKALLKKHLSLYADAGGKYITTYAVHSPWADNSYMIEGGMIEWIKKKDNTWSFDYKIFDEYVQLAMDCGINKAITLYTPVPWGERFRVKDEATGNYVYEQWKPETEIFKTQLEHLSYRSQKTSGCKRLEQNCVSRHQRK